MRTCVNILRYAGYGRTKVHYCKGQKNQSPPGSMVNELNKLELVI